MPFISTKKPNVHCVGVKNLMLAGGNAGPFSAQCNSTFNKDKTNLSEVQTFVAMDLGDEVRGNLLCLANCVDGLS